MRPRAVLFDFNGVLVDDERFHYRSLAEAVASEGVELSEATYWEKYLAYDDATAIEKVLADAGRRVSKTRFAELVRRKERAYERLLQALDDPASLFFPGAVELVRDLAERVPLAVVSGARRCEIEAVLKAGGIADAFRFLVAAGEAPAGKPDGAPYRAALEKMRKIMGDFAPAQALVLEDSPEGIAAARAAGASVWGVAHSYPAERLRGADRVVASLAEAGRELRAACAS